MMLSKTRSRSSKKYKRVFRSDAWLSRVRALGCIICGGSAFTHHIRHGQGMGQKAPDDKAIPLCNLHHQGEKGIHHLGTRAWEKLFGSEEHLLSLTLEKLNEK